MYDVMIIGGGVAGLMLAAKLAHFEIKVLVIEKEENSSSLYKGELLQPKSLEIFDKEKLLEKVLRNGKELPTVNLVELRRNSDHSFTKLSENQFQYDILPSLYHSAVMIPHEVLKTLLLEAAKSSSYFHYLRPAKFLGFSHEDEEQEKKARIRIANEEKLISARFYVGAEGRASVMRKEMNVKKKEHTYNHHFLTVSFPRPPNLQESMLISTQHRFLGLFPLPNNEVRTVLLIKPEEYKQMRREGLESFYKIFHELMPEMKGYVDQIRSWKKIQLMIPVRHNVSKYVKDNCLLMGDAAHSVHPMAGEGMNLAIQDADVLGELFKWMFKTKRLTNNQLLWYENVRKPRVEFLSLLSHQAALLYSFPYKWWQKVRIRGIQATENNSLLHFKQMLNTSGLGIWYFSLKDRLKQLNIIPYFVNKEIKNQKSYFFTEEDDYPWLYYR
ncbi:FAD-dependent oxidoreductase [Bacillus taeanensis]|uniref:FAD-dependent monooxygenase n=1 Tax=Bacillus taeanensis TaxID=273032 RepID=A0A366XT06_9BACI|nr:NAD(P)/FAD-dependent oxidoreductase [Bacillus taeanensis]RBW69510.1 FAD-dependent monooxygenase [Bacillus taeanensis]